MRGCPKRIREGEGRRKKQLQIIPPYDILDAVSGHENKKNHLRELADYARNDMCT